MSKPLIDNWTRYLVNEAGCWIWQGAVHRDGYGILSRVLYGETIAPRGFWVHHRGPIPPGLQVDHHCRVRQCVNPDHLEPVTKAMNHQRGLEARTLCRNGLHDITDPTNVKKVPKGFECLACRRKNRRRNTRLWERRNPGKYRAQRARRRKD